MLPKETFLLMVGLSKFCSAVLLHVSHQWNCDGLLQPQLAYYYLRQLKNLTFSSEGLLFLMVGNML